MWSGIMLIHLNSADTDICYLGMFTLFAESNY